MLKLDGLMKGMSKVDVGSSGKCVLMGGPVNVVGGFCVKHYFEAG